MTKKLKLSEIVTDAGTQVRAGLNEATVADYAEALAEGAKFPPVVVFHDGSRYIAADGFHRIHAALRNGATQIECDVRKGSKLDALKFALGCNAHHGLPRTNLDKRHAVGMAMKAFSNFSNEALAKICGVSLRFVFEIRKEAANQPMHGAQVEVPQKRIGVDGKERRLPPVPMRPRSEDGSDGIDETQVPPGRMVAAPLAIGSTAGKMTAATLLPPPAVVVDGTGWPIPTHLIPLWQRAGEVQELLTILSRVKGALRAAQEAKDKLFAEVSFSSALSQLNQAWTDIQTAKPFAVCPTCQGQLPDNCTLCRGRGLVSEYRWNTCVTSEDKAFRSKARKANLKSESES
jgi:hypothetical protein